MAEDHSLRHPTHPALAWRPATTADLSAWQRLVRRIEQHDVTVARRRSEDLRGLLVGGAWQRPQRESVLGLDDGGEPRAFGHVIRRGGAERRRRVFCWGGVDPAWRRRGIGASVLAWQEAVGRNVAAEAPGTVGSVLRMHGAADDDALRRLVLGGGFRLGRTYHVLTRPLAVAPPELAPARGVRLVAYRPHRDEAVRRAHNEAFAQHWGSEPRSASDWVRRTTGTPLFRPAWSRLALADEQVVGYAMCSRAPGAGDGDSVGALDIVGVLPRWRGRGVAGALLTDVLRAMQRGGVDRAVLDVDAENITGAHRLYERLGFVEQRRGRHVAYVKAL